MIFDSKTFTLLIFYVFKLYKLSNFLFTLSTYQEFKWHQVRDKLQAAQASSEMARNIYEQLNTEQKQKETTLFPGMQQITSESQHMSGEKENSTSMIYNHHGLHSIRTVDDKLKSTAAAMAAKLAASTSSAEMLSSLLSTLASEGMSLRMVLNLSRSPSWMVKCTKMNWILKKQMLLLNLNYKSFKMIGKHSQYILTVNNF
ncbi:hypothetical protein ZOSMA_386G00060 [Zostera marina]|uniref:Uncharacterized protein n=1 Tax=Zostera marina TaxID=29655 RepID=A0A0K9P776_ZOSMR|nr:hypothetical protein ZOSMA_386G00060 [Zostera marina]